jgi:environmental stress-induced protein Ves
MNYDILLILIFMQSKPMRPRFSVIHQSQYQEMPWKNGGGITQEIARDSNDENFRWRLSRAKIETSGPFSTFTGMDRCITLLEGAATLNYSDGSKHRLNVLEPFYFSGDESISCSLEEEAVDFNVIAKRTEFRIEVDCLTLDKADRLLVNEAAAEQFFYVQAGTLQIESMGQAVVTSENDTCHLSSWVSPIEIFAQSKVCVIKVRLFGRGS